MFNRIPIKEVARRKSVAARRLTKTPSFRRTQKEAGGLRHAAIRSKSGRGAIPSMISGLIWISFFFSEPPVLSGSLRIALFLHIIVHNWSEFITEFTTAGHRPVSIAPSCVRRSRRARVSLSSKVALNFCSSHNWNLLPIPTKATVSESAACAMRSSGTRILPFSSKIKN